MKSTGVIIIGKVIQLCNRKICVVFIILSGILHSCGPIFYAPNAQNVPVITEKEQFVANGTVGATNTAQQYGLQAAYGLTDALALQCNFSYFEGDDDDDYNHGSGYITEFGLGYYRNINSIFLFDVYGIAGYGGLENHFGARQTGGGTPYHYANSNFYRLAIQPGLTYLNEHYSLTFSTRIAQMNYHDFRGTYGAHFSSDERNRFQELKDRPQHFFVEPALTAKVGWGKVQFQLQFIRSFNVTQSDFPYDNYLFTGGLIFRM